MTQPSYVQAITVDADRPVTVEEWHGWGWEDNRHPDLHIGPVPGRKQLALFTEDGTGVRVLALFRNKRDAYAALCAIDCLLGKRP